jgi:N-dimethylarginine dimethylaminohydrolase
MRYGLNSEYGRLTAVLLHRPGPEIGNHPDPAAIQQLRQLDATLLAEELSAAGASFAALGVQTVLIDPTPLSADLSYLYNMMFCRDLFFMTPAGAIMASMANETRRGEVQYAARTLQRLGVPIIHQVCAEGRFEGADALWINRKLVAVGIGNRTNPVAFAQIKQVLAVSGIDCVTLPSSQKTTQHLLGSLQIVDRDLALVRSGITAPEVTYFLRQLGFTIISIPENLEVTTRQAMNIVTVAPRTIIMTSGCPETRQLYFDAGLTVAAELEISQLINGAGGLACATGIVGREESFDDSRSEML